MLKPTKPIKPTLEDVGYPFKSKYHSGVVETFQRSGHGRYVDTYLGKIEPASGVKKHSEHLCPKKLAYQFEEGFNLKISPKCCDKMKKEPLHKWAKENNKPYTIIGIMASEGGQRETAQCLAFKKDKLYAFQPLAPMTKEWEEWFIEKYDIEICEIYKPPYNFVRTGCKGCPFDIKLEDDLATLEKFFPNERKQCEIIWKPVYDEYRRLNYRLKQNRQMTFDDYL